MDKILELEKEYFTKAYENAMAVEKIILSITEENISSFLGDRYTFDIPFEENISTLRVMLERILAKKYNVKHKELTELLKMNKYFKIATQSDNILKISILNTVIDKLIISLGVISKDMIPELVKYATIEPLFNNIYEYRDYIECLEKIVL